MSVLIHENHQDLMFYLDNAGRQLPVKTVEDWNRRKSLILEAMQLIMGRLPEDSRKVPLDMLVDEEFHTEKFIRKRITFASEKKAPRVPAYLLIPHHVKAKVPAVLCLHPTHEIGKGIPAGLGSDSSRFYAKELVERGFVCLAPDYPGFGEYQFQFGSLGYVSGTMKAIWDNCRAVDLLQSLPEVDGERIGVIGYSLGGHNSIFTAAFEPRLKVIVSNCGFCAFSRYMKGDLKPWAQDRYMPLIHLRCNSSPSNVPFDFGEMIAALAPRPFLAISPLRDVNFDIQGVKQALAAAEPIYRLFHAERQFQSRHPDCGHDFPEEMRQAAYTFLEDNM